MEVFNRHDIEKMIVNKLEFNAITTKTNRYFIRYTLKIVKPIIAALLDVIMEELEQGNIINFQNYFSIKPVLYNEKKARNVVSGEEVIVPARYRFKVKAGKLIKQAIDRFNENIMNEE